MATSIDIRFSPRHGTQTGRIADKGPAPAIESSKNTSSLTTNSPFRVMPHGVAEFKDRRRRRRVKLQPMYTTASVRVLSRKGDPLEGHVYDISENGLAVEVDEQIGVGQPVTVEFTIAGLGRMRNEQWPMFVATAEVVRIDDLADFPKGPYRTALRFVRIATMAQAQIARYVAMQPASV